nr:hypothetical protein [Tanacetum cinerariifolium]
RRNVAVIEPTEPTQRSAGTPQSLWERACSRRLSVRHHKCGCLSRPLKPDAAQTKLTPTGLNRWGNSRQPPPEHCSAPSGGMPGSRAADFPAGRRSAIPEATAPSGSRSAPAPSGIPGDRPGSSQDQGPPTARRNRPEP